jgi:predicted PurR-regulated permease PerM
LVTCAGIVLVVAALALAKAFLIPVVLAILLTFILSPIVLILQRYHLGRVLAVLLVAVCAFSVLGGLGWVVFAEVRSLAMELPGHRDEIMRKIESINAAGKDAWLTNIRETIRDVTEKVNEAEPLPGVTREQEPVPVKLEPSGNPIFQWLAGSALETLVSAGLIVILVIFMLIQREDLRNRLIRLWGKGRLTTTTKAMDDAAQRISRYLLAQLLVNANFGFWLGLGLYFIGVPYAVLWGFLAAALRYVPYVGTWIAAALPIALSLAVLPGWIRPLLVMGLFLILEVVTYNVLETCFFGHSIGVSQTALLIAAAFWAWLWGPVGLVVAAPLTACLVVMGRYIPQLEFFAVLLGDEPVLDPSDAYFQRLLAKDQDEAANVVEDFLRAHPVEEIYDSLFLPALGLIKESRDRGELTESDEGAVLEATRQIADELVIPAQRAAFEAGEDDIETQVAPSAEDKPLVLGCPARDEVDEVALEMFGRTLDPDKCTFEVVSAKSLSAEIVSRVKQTQPVAICIGTVPPKGIAQVRYLCKRLRAQCPGLRIIVGCWGIAYDLTSIKGRLQVIGADQVAATFLDSRSQLAPLLQLEYPQPVPASLDGMVYTSQPE